MKFIPNAVRISFKSWSVWAGALAGTLAVSAGSLHAYDAAFPSALRTWGPTAEGWMLAASGFCGLVLVPILRGIGQNFGLDAQGQQIVSAIGTAPPGSSPTPPVVVSKPTAKKDDPLP